MLDLTGRYGIVTQTDIGFKDPMVFWRALRPTAPIEWRLRSIQPVTSPTLALHRRLWSAETGGMGHVGKGKKWKEMNGWDLLASCVNITARKIAPLGWQGEGLGVEDLCRMCTLRPRDIDAMLEARGFALKPRMVDNREQSAGGAMHWVLMDDGSLCSGSPPKCPYVQDRLFAHGAKLICRPPAAGPSQPADAKCRAMHATLRSTAQRNWTEPNYINAIVDQWAAVGAGFFLGFTGSSFDQVVCGLRLAAGLRAPVAVERLQRLV